MKRLFFLIAAGALGGVFLASGFSVSQVWADTYWSCESKACTPHGYDPDHCFHVPGGSCVSASGWYHCERTIPGSDVFCEDEDGNDILCGPGEDSTGSGCDCASCVTGPPPCEEKDPAAPACGVSPANGSEIKAFETTLEWTGISAWGEGCPNDNKYKVYLRERGTASDWSGTKVCEVGSGATSCDVDGLELCKTYEWKVRADNGSRHKDSGICTFSVNCDQTPPTGGLSAESPVCPHLSPAPTPNHSSILHFGGTTLTASNVRDSAGGWGVGLILYWLVLSDEDRNGYGDEIEAAGLAAEWGSFDWQWSDPGIKRGIYNLGWFDVIGQPEPITHSMVWDNTTEYGGRSRHLEDLPFGTYYVGLHLRDRAGNINGEADHTNVEIKCPGFIKGYVWEESSGPPVDGVQQAGESISTAATLELEDSTTGDRYSGVTPGGFEMAVEPNHQYRMYITASDCYCPTIDCPGLKWNRPPPDSPSDPVKLPDNPANYVSYETGGVGGTPFANLTPGDTMGQMERRYAYLGIQKADFEISGPSLITIDPIGGTETQTITVSVCKKHNYCWSPSGGTVLVSVSPAVSADGLVRVDSISPNPVTLPTDSSKHCADPVAVTFRAQPAASGKSYVFMVSGDSSPCGDHDDFNVTINVEHLAWFQSRAGDIYAKLGLSSYIPELPESFRSGFAASNYLSIGGTSPGIVLADGSIDLGTYGDISVEGWGDESYGEVGFYDGSKYLYDYSVFETTLAVDCTTSGSATMGDGGISGAPCSPDVAGKVIKVTGDLTVTNDVNFDGKKAVILVAGNITFDANFDPGGFYAFISRGNIEIDSDVENVRALLVADGIIYDYDEGEDTEDDWEDQANGLWVRGSAGAFGYPGSGSFNLARTRIGLNGVRDDFDDDLEPANYFSLDPEFFVELAPVFDIPRYTWKELE